MKHLLYIAIVFVLLSACSQGATPEEKAAQAAQEYFTLLKDNPELCEELEAKIMDAIAKNGSITPTSTTEEPTE